MTKTKIKLTQNQANALEDYFKSREGDAEKSINDHSKTFHDEGDRYLHEWSPLNGLSPSDMARALLIGYEIEPKFKAGDFVTHKKTGVVKEVTDDLEEFFSRHYLDKENLRHATHEEVMQEKDRQKFASIGRKPGEIKEGDIGENNTGKLIFSKSEIESAYKHDALKGLFPIEKFVCLWGDGDE